MKTTGTPEALRDAGCESDALRDKPAKVTWTPEAVRGLGVRTTVPIAGEILAGLSETQAYELAKRGGFPVPVVKVGRRLVVPTAPILRLLGLDHAADHNADSADPMPRMRAV